MCSMTHDTMCIIHYNARGCNQNCAQSCVLNVIAAYVASWKVRIRETFPKSENPKAEKSKWIRIVEAVGNFTREVNLESSGCVMVASGPKLLAAQVAPSPDNITLF